MSLLEKSKTVFEVGPDWGKDTMGHEFKVSNLGFTGIPIGDADSRLITNYGGDTTYGVATILRYNMDYVRMRTFTAQGEQVSDTFLDIDEDGFVYALRIHPNCTVKPLRRKSVSIPTIIRAGDFEFRRHEVRTAYENMKAELTNHPNVRQRVLQLCTENGSWFASRELVLARLGFIYGGRWNIHTLFTCQPVVTPGFVCKDKSIDSWHLPTTYALHSNGSMFAEVTVQDLHQNWAEKHLWNITKLRIAGCESVPIVL